MQAIDVASFHSDDVKRTLRQRQPLANLRIKRVILELRADRDDGVVPVVPAQQKNTDQRAVAAAAVRRGLRAQLAELTQRTCGAQRGDGSQSGFKEISSVHLSF